MKSIILIISLLTGLIMNNNESIDYDYEKAWKEVERFIQEGLPKSALTKSEEIYQMAFKENNGPQQVKATVFIARLQIQTDEKGLEASIGRLEKMIKTSKAPISNIAASYTAELLSRYFENYRWEISQRTTLVTQDDVDFRVWTTDKFLTTIEKYYLMSIENSNDLNVAVTSYGYIMNEYDVEALPLRPSLYEVLADRALDFFLQYSNYSTENTASFTISEPWYFDEVAAFTKYKINSTDTLSSRYQVIRLFQDILSRQIEASNIQAQADYDLKRLAYVYENAVLENKETYYTEALQKLAKSQEAHEFYAETMYVLARQTSVNTTDSTALVKALEFCQKAIKKYPKSSGGQKCLSLMDEIKQPAIQIFGEQVYPTKNQLLLALDYNNVESYTLETYKLDKATFNRRHSNTPEEILEKIEKSKKISTTTKALKPSKWYKSQRIELSHAALPYGQYAWIVRSGNVSQFCFFHVSDLAYTSYVKDNARVYIVKDRMTGQAVKNAKLSFYQQNYNVISRGFDQVFKGSIVTDKEGIATHRQKENGNYKVILEFKNDVLDLDQYHDYYGRYVNEGLSFAEVMTDRSIYRPGQIMYFKSILLKTNDKSIPTILANEDVQVTLRDANYQEVSKLSMTSNTFGSISGSFTLPTGKLNGAFTIQVENKKGLNGQKSIQVEEYKRPTFEVKMEDITQEYQLNDQIKLRGQATTLAGSVVDGAQVKYKVTRTNRYNGGPWYWRIPYPSNDFIIVQASTTANQEGKFEIEFKAVPDLKIAKLDQTTFYYSVEITVTDQRGETVSSNSSVAVAATAYSLTTNLPSEVDLSDLKKLILTATNSNGQKIDASSKMIISSLVQPKNVAISKYWDGKPDFPLPIPLYEKHFPHYSRNPETDLTTWPIDKKIYDATISTKDSIDLKSILTGGTYKLELESKDKNGKKIVSTQYCVVTDFKKSVFPLSSFLFTKTNQTTFEPGDVMEVSVGASQKKIHCLIVVEKDGQILLEKNVIANTVVSVSMPITEEHRGGLHVKLHYIIQNRSFEKSWAIDVPWSHKSLQITYETFRDKTLPGAEESYKIHIKGPKKDKVAAEMVAAMYDAALDQLSHHQWRSSFYPTSYAQIYFEIPGFYLATGQQGQYPNTKFLEIPNYQKPSLMPLIEGYYYGGGRQEMAMMKSSRSSAPESAEMANYDASTVSPQSRTQATNASAKNDADIVKPKPSPSSTRTNLKETVFFYPHLTTNADGNITLNFKINEALTKWKLMTFAHTTAFQTGYDERFVQTQKNLMVAPNAPRFLRDGDVLFFTAKVSNLSDQNLNGNAKIQIWDAITQSEITSEIIQNNANQTIDVPKGGSMTLSWPIQMPVNKYSLITYRVSAEAGDFTDGEENTIPVITNSSLVTEAMPMWLKGNETKSFVFNAFKNNNSVTKKDFTYTIEYTANPVWYAIQALPYINAGNNASTQTLIDQLYANTLAAKIANAHPKIKSVFEQWKGKDTDALLSPLAKNEALKSAVLEETPWVQQALSESEQKRNIALLFDLNQLAQQRTQVIAKLKERQLSNGGFTWLAGSRDDIYITQNIIENIGHLYHLGAMDIDDKDTQDMVSLALKYMDESLIKRYEDLQAYIKKHGGNLQDDHVDELSIHYLYIKTFFNHVQMLPAAKQAYEYYYGQIKKYWLKKGLYAQAMIGLVLHRNDDKAVNAIVKSLREKSFYNDELGMYWNEGNGFYWYQLPIERHALMLELFSEASPKKDEADKIKIWLLKNKQTTHWKTSKATAAAIYALLLQGENGQISQWVTDNKVANITLGKVSLPISAQNVEAGTGYFKKTYHSSEITKEMADIKITNPQSSIAWGAAYYQYFEQLDQIKNFTDTPLKLDKKLYKVVSGNKGDQLLEIQANTPLTPGDKIQVRIELRVDRPMEYVHMKDMRASGVEPINVLSSYKYQGPLGYYEATKDQATHFYFSYLPKGSFVFEYPVRVVHKGKYGAGITQIECMYAPEFNSHSGGSIIHVK